MDKKVSNKIWTLVNNVNPGTPKNITWGDAWEKLATWGGFEGAVDTKANGHTSFDLWIDDQKVGTFPIKNGWNEKEMDWNWDQVFGQMLDYIFSKGLIKKPRALRKDAKKQTARKPSLNRAKIAQISKQTEEMSNSIAEQIKAQNKRVFEAQWYSKENLAQLKKNLSNLSVKRYDYNKKGKDIVEIESKMAEIREQIKDIKSCLDTK